MKILRALYPSLLAAALLLSLPAGLSAQKPGKPKKPKKGRTAQVNTEQPPRTQPVPAALDPKTKEKVDYLFLEANTQYIQGNVREAINLFQQVVQLDPKHDASWYNIAKLALESGDADLAVQAGKQAVDLVDNNFWYYQTLSQAYEKKHDVERQITVLEKMVQQFPEEEDPRFDLAQAYVNKSRYADALEQYTALEKHGYNEEMIFRKYQLWMAIRQPEKALLELDKMIAANPRDPRPMQAKIELYQQTGREDEAMQMMEKFEKEHPGNGFVLLTLADFYRKKGDLKTSDHYLFEAFRSPEMELDNKIQIMSDMLPYAEKDPAVMTRLQTLGGLLQESDPKSAEVMAIRGDLFEMQGQRDSARACYDAALRINPSDPQIWEQLMLLDAGQRDYAALEKHAESALEYFPNQPSFLYFLGVSSQELKKTDQAVYAFEKVKKVAGSNTELMVQALVNLGDLYHGKQDYAKSDASYDEALRLSPGNAVALNNYAYFLSVRGENLDKAEEMIRKALATEPKSATFQDTYGWVLYRKGNYAEAEKWIAKAVEQDPGAEVLEHYGDVQWKLNQREKALEYWNKAIAKGARINLNAKQENP